MCLCARAPVRLCVYSFNGVLTRAESIAHFSLWAALKSPLLIGCDLRQKECQAIPPGFAHAQPSETFSPAASRSSRPLWHMCSQAGVPFFTNPEVLAVNQDPLGVQARRVRAYGGDKGIPMGKSGICGSEELPQNTIIAPCDAADPFQRWELLPNGTLFMAQTGECLQLDSGQGGCCGQAWDVWMNNAASGLCNDPASCCGARQQLWNYRVAERTLTNNVTGQCLTVHAGGLHNVGLLPCTPVMGGLQTWDWDHVTGTFVSSAAPPGYGNHKFCLARTKDVQGGALEVWAGPLTGGDLVVVLFNRNAANMTHIAVQWADVGLDVSKRMKVRDLWGRQDLGVYAGSFTTRTPVELHGAAMLRMTAA
jgi:hypothetical protein